jgi:DNA-binding NarL/FixJ family response regulator
MCEEELHSYNSVSTALPGSGNHLTRIAGHVQFVLVDEIVTYQMVSKLRTADERDPVAALCFEFGNVTRCALPNPPKVIVLTTFHLDEYVFGALRAGASGFLLKDTPPADIVHAVRLVAAGDAMLSPAVTRTLIGHFSADTAASRRVAAERSLQALTEREREVATQVGRGHSNADIARQMYMSEATVKAHLSRILAKLNAANRVQAAIIVRDAGLD